jgi:hypothetical protein
MSGRDAQFGRCDICGGHSKLTAGSIAKIRIDDDILSLTKATHHPNCMPLTERENCLSRIRSSMPKVDQRERTQSHQGL